MAVIFNIQRFSIHDGPGIRTTVFFKGCPLACRWCSNPESITTRPELGVNRSRCSKCGKCSDICPKKAIAFEDDVIRIDRARCNVCGWCVEVCNSEALCIYGKEMSVAEVFEEVRQDELFYRSSGGGVTVSGGEPLLQTDFVISLFRVCREAGIHTCVETAAYVNPGALRKVLQFTDYVLFDIKHMDSGAHHKFTGRPNDLVLANAKVAAASGVHMVVRVPVIPSVNDCLDNIRETTLFVKSLREDIGIELLAYHRMGLGKYHTLDKSYLLDGVEPPQPDHMEYLRQVVKEYGVSCTR